MPGRATNHVTLPDHYCAAKVAPAKHTLDKVNKTTVIQTIRSGPEKLLAVI